MFLRDSRSPAPFLQCLRLLSNWMALPIRLYGQVEFAFLCCSWPQSEEEQHAFLCNVDVRAWRLSGGCGVEKYLADHRSRLVAKLSLQTRFGHRWFHVWQAPNDSKLLVVKESAPATPLMVNCAITVGANRPGIHADFTLLSGRPLGARAFENISPEKPLLAWDLKSTASSLALENGLLESRHQVVGLVLAGFANGFPDGLLLTERSTLTHEELQHRLHYLKSLANEPALPEEWNCLRENSSFSSSSSDVQTDESLTGCTCEGA